MDALRGSGNAGKTVVLEEEMKVTPIGFPPEDAQSMETRLIEGRQIYGAHGVPPKKVGDLERATFSKIEQQSLDHPGRGDAVASTSSRRPRSSSSTSRTCSSSSSSTATSGATPRPGPRRSRSAEARQPLAQRVAREGE